MKNFFKDLGIGLASLGVLTLLIFGFISFMEFMNMTKDTIMIVLTIPFVIYLSWIFGSLTRSLYLNKK